jgi:type 1 glutamine amidotransferase
MIRRWAVTAISLFLLLPGSNAFAQAPAQQASPPKVLLFFSLNVEADHMLFATDAMRFFGEQADQHNFRVEATSNWADMNDENLKQYKLVVWLNGTPPGPQQPVFQRYMEGGGAWLGFHVAAYNDRNSRWTWFKQFIGGGAFGVNNWPPYSWRPSPRLDKNIHVLLTLDPSEYPLGIKGLITEKDPDVPVVWTNTNFKMLYLNMGHGDKVFSSPTQNKLFENGILWLLGKR